MHGVASSAKPSESWAYTSQGIAVFIRYRLTASNTGDDGACVECTAVVAKAKRVSDSDLPPDSSKTRKIVEILREIDERSDGEDRTIIFSQFTSMLDIIEPFLEAEGIQYVRCKYLVLGFVRPMC